MALRESLKESYRSRRTHRSHAEVPYMDSSLSDSKRIRVETQPRLRPTIMPESQPQHIKLQVKSVNIAVALT